MTSKSRTTPLELGPHADPELAARYRDWLGTATSKATDSTLGLYLDGNGLAVVEDGRIRLRPDFAGGSAGWRLSRASIKGEALARACGLKHGRRPAIVDATAGLGQDGLLLARLGCRVTLIERSPVLAALLDDALRRARLVTWLADAVARIELVHGDARDALAGQDSAHRPDVVYLDPMFEPDQRRGAAAKGTRLLERIAGLEGDGDDLLEPARQTAQERVVVKRHRRAEPLAGVAPDFRINGRSTRFDAYLPAETPR
jgi:16S rRNA (guanine1516-N2)-methyltransferase